MACSSWRGLHSGAAAAASPLRRRPRELAQKRTFFLSWRCVRVSNMKRWPTSWPCLRTPKTMAPTNIVTLTIKEEMVEQFIAVAMEDSRASLENENGGCLRFDVLRDSLTPNKFIFYEMCALVAPPGTARLRTQRGSARTDPWVGTLAGLFDILAFALTPNPTATRGLPRCAGTRTRPRLSSTKRRRITRCGVSSRLQREPCSRRKSPSAMLSSGRVCDAPTRGPRRVERATLGNVRKL